MSSGSPGRYQSRLFNFVHQQSRRLAENVDHTLRHLQVATKWGVEALLYPIYLFLNSTATTAKVLGTQEPVSRPQLSANDSEFSGETSLPSDTPIQQVLKAVKSLPSELDTKQPKSTPGQFLADLWGKFFTHPPTKSNSPQSLASVNPESTSLKYHAPVVQGIATNLVNRNLVLVTGNNEILDILTPQQQAKLEARIIHEIGNYWHSWQLAVNQKEKKLLPEIHRILGKLTGSTQAKIPELTEGMSKDLLITSKLLVLLDTSIAKLETNAILPVQQRSQEIVRIAQTQLDIFLYGKKHITPRGDMAVNVASLETQTLNIQAVIAAAINYFFGVNKGNKIETKDSHNYAPGKKLPDHNFQELSPSSYSQHEVLVVDPWLNWNDLFGKADAVTHQPITSPPNPAKDSRPSPQNNNSQPKKKFNWLPSKKINRHLSNQATSGKQNQIGTSKAIIKSQKHTQIEAQPDWIDVEAIFIGYDKHPLEQLLQWLDSAILWLEEIVMKVFQALRRLWRGK